VGTHAGDSRQVAPRPRASHGNLTWLTIDIPARPTSKAIRCYQKVGFRPVGVMRRYERSADGRFHDGLLMDLIRDELSLCAAWTAAPAPP
jgi:hypothetical protein